jgi:hypothetical protein
MYTAQSCSNWWRMLPRRGVWLAMLAALLIASSTACTSGSADTRTHSALNALAQVVDPAWSLAEDACLASQRVVVARETSGNAEAADTDAALAVIRAKCDVVTEAFQRIRAAHAEARLLLEHGEVARAEDKLVLILTQWQQLRGGEHGP